MTSENRRDPERPPRPGMIWSDQHQLWMDPDTRSPERKKRDEAIARDVESRHLADEKGRCWCGSTLKGKPHNCIGTQGRFEEMRAENVKLQAEVERLNDAINNLTPPLHPDLEKRALELQYREVIEAAGDLLYPKRQDSAEPYMRLKRLVDDHRKQPEKRKSERPDPCIEDQHRGTECRCCHLTQHCCSHHCCCFYRCRCRHQDYRHPEKGKCDFPGCACLAYNGR